MRPELNLKTILLGIGVLAVSFLVSLKAMDWLSPRGINKPVLATLPPLPPVARSSSIVAPITIPLAVIRDAADRAAPHNFAGKADNPAAQILQNADIGDLAGFHPSPVGQSGAARATHLIRQKLHDAVMNPVIVRVHNSFLVLINKTKQLSVPDRCPEYWIDIRLGSWQRRRTSLPVSVSTATSVCCRS